MTAARVACLTPAGRGAIAVLRIEGPAAASILDRVLLGGRRRPSAMATGEIRLFRLGQPAGEEVVVARLGEQLWELGCHGGTASVDAALARLEAAGATREAGTETLPRGATPRLAAEALIDLGAATTLRTAAILLDQSQGALDRALNRLISRITSDDNRSAWQELDALLRFAPLGLHLTRPWKVVLLGAPNVGKSSLLNALAGYERALTHAEPGTTRDVVTLNTAFDGWPVELADTAGQREATDPLEAAGAQLGRATADEADLVLLVCDRSRPWSEAEQALAQAFPQALTVLNKRDLAPHERGGHPAGISVSAKSGEGLAELATAIVRALAPEAPSPGAAAPFRAEQVAGLRSAREALAAGNREAALAELRQLSR